MSKGLNKTELTGLLLLAILIVAVTACAFFLKGCDGNGSDQTEYPVQVVDSLTPGSDYYDTTPRKNTSGRSSRKKSGGRKKSAAGKASPGRAGQKGTPVLTDPFADTIPLEWDDPEEFDY